MTRYFSNSVSAFAFAISAVILHPEGLLCHLPSEINPDALTSPPSSLGYDALHDPLPNPNKLIQYVLMTAFPVLKDNFSLYLHHFLLLCLPELLPKFNASNTFHT
jgi:hypothetical protein